MRTYVIRENQIAVLHAAPKDPVAGAVVVQSIKDIDARRFTTDRLVQLCNALLGAGSVKRFASRKAAVKRFWAELQKAPGGNPRRTHSKQAQVIALLKRAGGAGIEEMTLATGWQKHTVRGLMSGALKKRLGLAIKSERAEKGMVYRIAS